MAVTSELHFRSIDIEDAVIVGLVILREDFVKLRRRGVTVIGAGFFSHADTAERHESTLERLIGLKTNNLFQILIEIARCVGSNRGNDFRIHVEHATLGTFFFLELLEFTPELVRSVRRTGEERFVAIIRLVVFLNKVADVDFFLPNATFKAFPSFILNHNDSPFCFNRF